MPKPRPLSKKKTLIYHKRDSLGDSSEETPSQSDETTPQSADPTAARSGSPKSAEKENQSPPSRQQRLLRSQRNARSSAGQFLTPDKEVTATDYSLEFTTSNIQNPSPRRCSTLRTMSSQEEQETSEGRGALQGKQVEMPSTRKDARKQLRKSKRGRPSKKSKSTNENEDDKEEEEKDASEESNGRQDREEQRTRRTLREANTSQSPRKKTGKGPALLGEVRRQQPKSLKKPPNPNQPSEDHTSTSVAQSKRKQSKPKNTLQYKIMKEQRFLREIRHLQNCVNYLIPRLPFSRVIREIMHMCSNDISYITPSALEALQAASEMYLTQRLQDAYMLTLHRGRVTLEVRDMHLINYLKMNL